MAADDRPCGAYACGEAKCKTACGMAEDCALGYTCTEQGICVPGSSCTKELTRSTGVSGERSCAPLLCDPATGACRQLCSTSGECVTGYVCDSAIKACIAAAQAQLPEDESGCGCRVAGGQPCLGVVGGSGAAAGAQAPEARFVCGQVAAAASAERTGRGPPLRATRRRGAKGTAAITAGPGRAVWA